MGTLMKKLANYLKSTGVVILGAFLLQLVFLVGQMVIEGNVYIRHLELSVIYMMMAALLTGAIVIVIGIPVYTIMCKLRIASIPCLALAGFMIPVTAMILIEIVLLGDNTSSYGEHFHGEYRDMMVSGQRTVWGWIRSAEIGALFGLCGLSAAVLFAAAMEKFENPNPNLRAHHAKP